MTQELACLLIGLGCLVGSAIGLRVADDQDSNLLAFIACALLVFGMGLLVFATVGYISSLPSINEVGR